MAAFYDAAMESDNFIEIDPPDALAGFGLEDFYAYPGAWPDGLTLLTFPSADELYPASLSAFYDDVVVNVSLLYADAAVVMKRTTSDLRDNLLRLQRRVVAPRDGLEVGRRLCYFPRPPSFSFLDCGRALPVELAPPDGRRLRLRGFVRYRRESARRRRLSGARVRGFTKAAPGLALCWEVEGHWSRARPRGVGRAAGAVAAGFGVRAPLIV